jgi:demethylmenaquinone methyltransferase/2-methoxy-6-polyprenyl-1,4-benzoquinol methylase
MIWLRSYLQRSAFYSNSDVTFKSAEEKRAYVNNMFSRIARRYDLMNRIMTGGQDIRWRKLLIRAANLPAEGGRLLDIATGTGDIAFEALRQHPNLKLVVGADFTLPMIYVGQGRARGRPIRWTTADTLCLPFPNNSFDAVVSGFLLRNVIDVFAALVEQTRVCRPGGRIVILEIPRPADNLFGQLFRFYFHRIVPVGGRIISGQGDAYKYLPASADAFLRPEELKVEMERAGLSRVSYRMLMFGAVALHIGEKT